MQTDPKRIMLAASLVVAIACAGMTGCSSEGRTAGTRLDDHNTTSHVKSALSKAPVYKFPDVRVEVFDGIAQLSGFADTKEQKQYAGDVVSRVDGVRQVINGISVKPSELVAPAGYTYGRQYPPPPTASNPTPNQNVPAKVAPVNQP